MTPAVFAIPGDITQLTGGFIYERKLLEALRAEGRRVEHLELPPGFPDATPEETKTARRQLTAIPADVPVILDGSVFGSIDPEVLDAMSAPVVAMLHHPLGLETGLTEDRAQHLLTREAENLRRAAHVVVPSPHTSAILQKEFGVAPERISIALPGFDRPPVVEGAKPTPPLILAVGLLTPRKGHDVLIDALAEIADLDWRAQIVGSAHDPEVADALAARIARLGLSERVQLAGRMERDALNAAYSEASIFALATRYEGYGIVFGEAMLHGLPIVTCRTGAVPDTVPPDAGILVPVDAHLDFAEALRQLLQDADLRERMGAASAVAGTALPDWRDTAAIMGSVLDSL
ncbi:glycosyltransferase family 4 protein [Thioclava sp. F28-4]|uniref:glycosyltransferase family 4 protein n=1 Tax=Thioclava sp. F28-4 TaxID=1915315 RepID=UPI00099694AC|nr:glycosyltransferase family 4 protein [Thioclava sp. F28-4]OOY06639.1 glycosyl transferase family 1 [Thioclava sp. F28-4]